MTDYSLVSQSSQYIFKLNLNKILIIDDAFDNLGLLKLIFRMTEFEVISACNGAEGLKKAREEQPFLILSDIMMPIMDGFTLCEQLKAEEETRHISIILITSYNRSETHVKRGLSAGADDFITRPISPKDLLSRVHTVARLKHAELEAQRDATKTAQENRELAHINALVEQKVTLRNQELLHEKTKLETILRNMADGVLILDPQSQIQTINEIAKIILSVSDDILGKSIKDFSLSGKLWQAIQTIVDDKVDDNAFIQITHPDNTSQAIRIHVTQITMNNVTEGWIVLLSDISSIVEAEQMKVRFMTGVTHELKTPLSIIQLQINNILKYHKRLPTEKQLTMLKGVLSQTNLLSKLIDDVLTLARLGSHKSENEQTQALLGEAIKQTLEKISPLAIDKTIEIAWIPKVDAQTMLVAMTVNDLKLIIGNLLENAIKYTQSNGRITIVAKKIEVDSQTWVEFSITDTGIGISRHDQAHIFDRFFRADTTHAIPGTGLGLAIVKETVLAHGGDITVTSNPGHGSTFTVTLPSA